MSFDAKVLEVMIASPGGLDEERDIVEEVIAEWNAVYAFKQRLVLLARRWERNSSAELSGRAQGMINERILDSADILIGVFHLRIGTPTGEYESGTVEEIKRHHTAGKPVMLYFSRRAATPGYDPEQYSKVDSFQKWAREQGIVGSFESIPAFKDTLNRELPLMLNKNPYITKLTDVDFVQIFEDTLHETRSILSGDAANLLLQASEDKHGGILVQVHMAGTNVVTGGRNLVQEQTPREVARWLAAVNDLSGRGLAVDHDGKGQYYKISHTGWLEIDRLKAQSN